MKPGIYSNEELSNDVYHAGPGISKSGLDRIDKSPAHYLSYRKKENKQTDAMRFGAAMHTCFLEPAVFAAEYVIEPKFSGTGSVAAKREWREAHEGFTLIKTADMELLKRMRDSLYSHPAARYLLDQIEVVEQSHFWEDPETGILCKCRLDAMTYDRFILDLKSSMEYAGAPDEFPRHAYNYRYHLQPPWYSEGVWQTTKIEPAGFFFLVVEKEPPFAVGVYQFDDETIEVARRAMRVNLLTYEACMSENHWPAYSERVETVGLPRWALNKEESKYVG